MTDYRFQRNSAGHRYQTDMQSWAPLQISGFVNEQGQLRPLQPIVRDEISQFYCRVLRRRGVSWRLPLNSGIPVLNDDQGNKLLPLMGNIHLNGSVVSREFLSAHDLEYIDEDDEPFMIVVYSGSYMQRVFFMPLKISLYVQRFENGIRMVYPDELDPLIEANQEQLSSVGHPLLTDEQKIQALLEIGVLQEIHGSALQFKNSGMYPWGLTIYPGESSIDRYRTIPFIIRLAEPYLKYSRQGYPSRIALQLAFNELDHDPAMNPDYFTSRYRGGIHLDEPYEQAESIIGAGAYFEKAMMNDRILLTNGARLSTLSLDFEVLFERADIGSMPVEKSVSGIRVLVGDPRRIDVVTHEYWFGDRLETAKRYKSAIAELYGKSEIIQEDLDAYLRHFFENLSINLSALRRCGFMVPEENYYDQNIDLLGFITDTGDLREYEDINEFRITIMKFLEVAFIVHDLCVSEQPGGRDEAGFTRFINSPYFKLFLTNFLPLPEGEISDVVHSILGNLRTGSFADAMDSIASVMIEKMKRGNPSVEDAA
ncbi:MAG: hypothetical protein JW774_11490 [Candidatus Aureabacteria bacterium]|nr:hypothetical protein [Candidatus Auribacterota bacterium]